jgi:hypothetical protein
MLRVGVGLFPSIGMLIGVLAPRVGQEIHLDLRYGSGAREGRGIEKSVAARRVPTRGSGAREVRRIGNP